MYYEYSSLRKILINNSEITALVPSSNISVGYLRSDDSFPKIALFRAGGSSVGRLGYKTSSVGNKESNRISRFQIDILSRDSIEDLENIDDVVIKALLSGSKTGESLTLDSDNSFYDPNYDAFRIVQVWSYNRICND